MQRYTKAFLLAATTMALTSPSIAKTEDDIVHAAKAVVSLTQAITTAEQHIGGRATKARFEHHKGLSIYEVEIAKGDQVFDVIVDSERGKVLSAKEDHADNDNEDEQDD